MPINVRVVETIIKSTHIFNNIHIASKLHVIKVSPKLDITIVWIDIWDSQSSSSTKMLINCYFNVGSHIATMQDATINSNITQCKNCQK